MTTLTEARALAERLRGLQWMTESDDISNAVSLILALCDVAEAAAKVSYADADPELLDALARLRELK